MNLVGRLLHARKIQPFRVRIRVRGMGSEIVNMLVLRRGRMVVMEYIIGVT
jgi:hypothetical protein